MPGGGSQAWPDSGRPARLPAEPEDSPRALAAWIPVREDSAYQQHQSSKFGQLVYVPHGAAQQLGSLEFSHMVIQRAGLEPGGLAQVPVGSSPHRDRRREPNTIRMRQATEHSGKPYGICAGEEGGLRAFTRPRPKLRNIADRDSAFGSLTLDDGNEGPYSITPGFARPGRTNRFNKHLPDRHPGQRAFFPVVLLPRPDHAFWADRGGVSSR